MLDQLTLLLTTIFVTFALYPFWINFVYKFQMGENIRKDGPQTHQVKQGTPTMGGFVFLLSISLITLLFNQSRTQTLFPLFIVAMAGFLGLLEDFAKVYRKSGLRYVLDFNNLWRLFTSLPLIKQFWTLFLNFSKTIGSAADRGMQTHTKLLIEAVIGGFVAYWTYFKLGWDYIWFPLIGNINIGFFYPIFIFFLFIMVLNFVAFTDGVDGLAGGLAAIAFCAYWVIAAVLEYNSLSALAATFIGALLPFLYFNVNPARIFMGDVGSHALGAALAIFAVVMHREIALFFILAVFLLDGLTSPLQQYSVRFTKRRLFRMAPIHHHFELLGWPETKVTFRFWIFGAFFAFLGVFVALL